MVKSQCRVASSALFQQPPTSDLRRPEDKLNGVGHLECGLESIAVTQGSRFLSTCFCVASGDQDAIFSLSFGIDIGSATLFASPPVEHRDFYVSFAVCIWC